MKYRERAEKFREAVYRENRRESLKWRNPDELHEYLKAHGGGLKEGRKRRRGYLVCVIQERTISFPALVVEVPNDFAERVMALGGFP